MDPTLGKVCKHFMPHEAPKSSLAPWLGVYCSLANSWPGIGSSHPYKWFTIIGPSVTDQEPPQEPHDTPETIEFHQPQASHGGWPVAPQARLEHTPAPPLGANASDCRGPAEGDHRPPHRSAYTQCRSTHRPPGTSKIRSWLNLAANLEFIPALMNSRFAATRASTPQPGLGTFHNLGRLVNIPQPGAHWGEEGT